MEFHTLGAEHKNLRAPVLVRDAGSVSRSWLVECNVLVGDIDPLLPPGMSVDCLEVRDGTKSLF